MLAQAQVLEPGKELAVAQDLELALDQAQVQVQDVVRDMEQVWVLALAQELVVEPGKVQAVAQDLELALDQAQDAAQGMERVSGQGQVQDVVRDMEQVWVLALALALV